MKWRLVSYFLAACAIPVGTHSCSTRSDEDPGRRPGGGAPVAASGAGASAGAGAAAKAGGKKHHASIQRGRFADAMQVGKNRWVLLNDTPPPLEQDDEFSIDGDGDGDGGGRGGDGSGQRRPGGERRKRFGQSPVYVDGVPIAVVAYGELPAWLPTRWFALNDGRKVIRFVFADYLSALGIPLRRVQAVHLYGGRGRVGIIPGAELRRVKDQLLFSFTKGDDGKMRMHWTGDVQVSDSIDKVQAVAVYVERKPPRWDRGQWGLVDDKGVEYRGIPYAEAPLKGGVRVYLDGRIAHVLKRNRTFARKIEPARMIGGVPHFQMFTYLDEIGIDAKKVAAVELMAENRVALRLDGPSLAAERSSLELSAPPQSSGRVLVHLGPAANRRSLEVTAINLYTAKRANAHERR
jgi:hypothetical protein